MDTRGAYRSIETSLKLVRTNRTNNLLIKWSVNDHLGHNIIKIIESKELMKHFDSNYTSITTRLAIPVGIPAEFGIPFRFTKKISELAIVPAKS